MATRAEIEARMAALTKPRKTRAQIEAEMAAAPAKGINTQEYLNSDKGKAELAAYYREQEQDNSFLENAAIKSGDVVAGMGRGLQQLAARAAPNTAAKVGVTLEGLQQEEAENRARMTGVNESAGGITGNILTNAALFAIPGAKVGQVAGKVGQAATIAPQTATLLASMLGEGALGAAGAALQPTVEGESVTDNMAADAALNAIMPAGGALLRSTPVQKAADFVLDYTPFVAGARRRARNVDIKAGNEAARADYLQEKSANVAQQKAVEAERKAAEKEAAQRTKYAQALRDQEAVQKKQFLTAGVQDELAADAGWTKFPTDKLGVEAEVRRVGKEYGDLIAPVRMEPPKLDDLQEAETNAIGGYVRKLSRAAEKNGGVHGETYKEVRADIMEELQTAQGEARGQLKTLLERLDQNFEAAIPPEIYDDVVKKRAQYSLGATMRGADWKPGTGADIESLRKRLDTRGIADATRQKVYKWAELAGDTKGVDAVEPIAPREIPDAPVFDRLPPEKTPLEQQDLVRLGAVNIAALQSLGPAAAALPLGALAIKGANNKNVSKTVAALRRGGTIGYGTVLAPEDDE